MVSWVDSVKEYAKQSGGTFKIPKKDSDEYKAIKELQEKMTIAELRVVEKTSKRVPKVAPKVEEPVVEVITKAPIKAKKIVPVVVPVEVKVEAPVDFKVKKTRIPKVASTVALAPAPVASAIISEAPIKAPRVKKEKIPGKVVEPVVEVEDTQAPVKAPRKSNKVQKEEKLAARSVQSEEHSRGVAKKALDDARMIITQRPIVMRFD
jgi:hypothetical protein